MCIITINLFSDEARNMYHKPNLITLENYYYYYVYILNFH